MVAGSKGDRTTGQEPKQAGRKASAQPKAHGKLPTQPKARAQAQTTESDQTPAKPTAPTRNDALVLATLEAAAEPLSAYAILDRLRDEGLRGPAQIYRALDRLRAAGRVHRLESLNAFVACRHEHEHDEGAGVTVFVICDDCGHTEEVCEPALGRELSRLARRAHFEARESTVELRGRCQGCGAG